MRLPADKVTKLRTFYQGRTVCVTGGAGFIGGHLCDALLSMGAEIRVIDDLSNSSLEHLSGLIELEPDRVKFIHASVLDDDALKAAMVGAQTVFHLAALGSVPRSVEEPQRTWSVNATGTLRVLEAARAAKALRVVFAASSSAYGDQPELPKVESMPVQPLSPYAASKLAGEQLLAVWSKCYGLSTASLRYFNIFGPRQSADSAYAAVVAAFAKALFAGEAPTVFGDGSQSRDFTFVSNAVLATLLAGSAPTRLTGQVMNIGTGRRVTVAELATVMARQAGTPHVHPVMRPARAGDVMHSLADISLAKELIGYEPVATLEDGLAETMEWYKRVFAGT
ncbi:MAG: SDR family NAD(P)-dependent oxidoreductase [Tepidisphaera sp.]|nr:SDR family NAD(P)-dependent oxidoreductase [Tepidisphaera sp.]